MAQVKINQNWDRAYKILSPLLIVGFLAYFLNRFISQHSGALSGQAVFLTIALGILVSYFGQAIIHEMGHFVFGRFSGYRFQSFRVGNFILLREGGRIRGRKLSLSDSGSQCVMIPPDPVNGDFPFAQFIMGGVIANLLASALFGFLAFLLLGNLYLSLFFFIAALMGLVRAYLTGVPMTLNLVDNDGRNLKTLRQDPQARRSFWIQLKVKEALAQGTRLKDMPGEWFQLPQGLALDNSLNAALAALKTNRLLDEGKFQEADVEMKRLLSSGAALSDLHRKLLLADRIFIEVVQRNVPKRLEKLISKSQQDFMKAMIHYPSVLRTEYAHALINQKNPDKAARFKKGFDKMAATHPYPAEIKSERALMAAAVEAAKKQAGLKRARSES